MIAALPLGGRIKIDPWSARLALLKSKPIGQVAEYEKMPFEITPFMLFLTRQGSDTSVEMSRAEAATPPETNDKPE